MACRFIMKFPKDFIENFIQVSKRHNKYVTVYRLSGFPNIDIVTNKINSLQPDKEYLVKLTLFKTVPDPDDFNIPKVKNVILNIQEAPKDDPSLTPASLFYHSEILPSLLEPDRSLFYYGLGTFTPVFFLTNVIMNTNYSRYQTKIRYILFYFGITCDRNAINTYYDNLASYNIAHNASKVSDENNIKERFKHYEHTGTSKN